MIQPGRDGLCRQREIAGGSGDDRGRAGRGAAPAGRRAGAVAAAAGASPRPPCVALTGSALASPGAAPAAQAAPGIGRSGLGGALLIGDPAPRAGRSPVPFRRAQLSVPGSWLVQSPGQFWCAPRSRGMIFAGGRPAVPKGRAAASPRAWPGSGPPGTSRRESGTAGPRPSSTAFPSTGCPVARGSCSTWCRNWTCGPAPADRWPAGCWPH